MSPEPTKTSSAKPSAKSKKLSLKKETLEDLETHTDAVKGGLTTTRTQTICQCSGSTV